MAESAEELIDGAYLVDLSHKLPLSGGGLPAFRAIDRRSEQAELMAVRVAPDAPPRAGAIASLQGGIPGVLAPLAHGRSGGHCWVICQAPQGAPVGVGAPWSEQELVLRVVRPVARALEALREARATHRAIRPDNLFRLGAGHPVVLGCAWAAPPAMHQPASFEPPYSAICDPAGRGAGVIADDVYALGVLLIALGLGRMPLADLPPAEIARRKLTLGCYAALVGDQRLPSNIVDLVRGMLAEDPEHRSSPALLADPQAASVRRLGARPARRAQRPLDLSGRQVWTSRGLALEVALAPESALALLRSGEVELWLRRSLMDALSAAKLEEARRLHRDGERGELRPAADRMLLLRTVALLDPLAPLCWGGIRFWPEGFGALLAARQEAETVAALETLVDREAIVTWSACRSERDDTGGAVQLGRQIRAMLRGSGRHAMTCILYATNPLLACRSPHLAAFPLYVASELLPVLESHAAQADRRALPLDAEIEALLVARGDERMAAEAARPSNGVAPSEPVRQLRLLARLQGDRTAHLVPNLARWLVAAIAAAPPLRRSRAGREALLEQLGSYAERGDLGAMVVLLDDETECERDTAEAADAEQAIAEIAELIRTFADSATVNREHARRVGRSIAAGLGLGLAACVALLALV